MCLLGLVALGARELVPRHEAILVLVLLGHELGGHVRTLLLLEPLLDLVLGELAILVAELVVDLFEDVGLRRRLADLEALDGEFERRAAGDVGTRTLRAVALLRRNDLQWTVV